MNSVLFSCLIIDNDPSLRNLLHDKLKDNFPDIKVLATAANGDEGLQKIKLHQPDLIFLEIEMPEMTGFDVLSRLKKRDFETIFITSVKHYAIEAIRFDALDYLVKPVDAGELKRAINRFKVRKRIRQATGSPVNGHKKPKAKKLVLNTLENELLFPLEHIVRIEGQRNYSSIFFANEKKHVVSKTLMEMEELLSNKDFFRCHKSHIINFSHIQSVINSNFVILSSDLKIPVARRKKIEFQVWYEGRKNGHYISKN